MKHILLGVAAVCSSFVVSAQVIEMVKDISTGSGNSAPTRMTTFGKQLLMFANDLSGSFGNELYALDSTGEVSLVYNIAPGSGSSASIANYLGMATLNGKVYFPGTDGTHGNELFSWDGMGAPVMVNDFNPGSGSSNPNEVITYNNSIVFTASSTATGTELFVHNPIGNTVQLLADILPGASSSFPQNLTMYNGKLYFSASNGTDGRELFVYDGDSVRMVMDINAGAGSSDPQSLVQGGGRLYFSAFDATYGRELYALLDTTVSRLTDVAVGAASTVSSASTGQARIAYLNNTVYFSGNDGGTGGVQLYKYDMKAKQSSLVYKINPIGSANPANFIRYNNRLFFAATDGVHGIELWSYDGKTMPYMVADIDTAGSLSSNPVNFVIHNNALYFSAREAEYGTELYMYKDTTLGVQKITFDADVVVYPNPVSSNATINISLKSNQQLAIALYDITGKQLYSSGMKNFTKGSNDVTIPMQSLSAGVYFYTISGSESVLSKGRLIKD